MALITFSSTKLFERDADSSFTTDDRSVIGTALKRLSKTIYSSESALATLLSGLVVAVQVFHAATLKAKKAVEWQRTLPSVTKKSNKNVINDVASFCRWAAVASTSEAERLSSSSAASN